MSNPFTNASKDFPDRNPELKAEGAIPGVRFLFGGKGYGEFQD